MPSLSLKINEQQLQRAMRDLQAVPRGLPKAIVGAINDTAREMATSTKQPLSVLKQITRRVQIKAKDVRSHIHVQRANRSRMRADIRLSESQRLSLKVFGARQIRRGVSYKIERGGRRQTVAGAFIALGGHAWRRIGRSRLPIVKLHGPSPWGVFVKALGAESQTATEMERRMAINLDQRVQFLLKKARGEI